MGIHTWFVKDADVHIEYMKERDKMANGDITAYEAYEKWSKIYHDDNEAEEYFNLFRASGGDDWDYLESFLLRSYEETIEFIANPYNEVRKGDYPWEEGMRLLKQYWEEYPNGGIYFG